MKSIVDKIKNILSNIKLSLFGIKKNEKAQEEKKKIGFSDDELGIINRAMRIVNEYENFSEAVSKCFKEHENEIDVFAGFDVRFDLYNSMGKYGVLELIAYDLKYKILPFINEYLFDVNEKDEIFNILDAILDYFDGYKKDLIKGLVQDKVNNNTTRLLDLLGLSVYEQNYLQALELISDIECKNYSSLDWHIVIEVRNALEQSLIDFKNVVLMHAEYQSDDSLNMFLEIVKELNFCLEQLNLVYSNFLKVFYRQESHNIIDSKGLDFYKSFSDVKNIFCFLDAEGYNSVVDKDILETVNFTAKNNGYGLFANTAGLFVTSDFASDKGHLVKSDNYTKVFLKDYHIRSFICGYQRLFMGRYRTNLHNILPDDFKEDTCILLVYGFMYGDTAGNEKYVINKTALDRCYKNRERIDEICALLNTDVSKLSEQEKKKVQQRVCEYLNKEMDKMDYLLEQNRVRPNMLTRGRKK